MWNVFSESHLGCDRERKPEWNAVACQPNSSGKNVLQASGRRTETPLHVTRLLWSCYSLGGWKGGSHGRGSTETQRAEPAPPWGWNPALLGLEALFPLPLRTRCLNQLPKVPSSCEQHPEQLLLFSEVWEAAPDEGSIWTRRGSLALGAVCERSKEPPLFLRGARLEEIAPNYS